MKKFTLLCLDDVLDEAENHIVIGEHFYSVSDVIHFDDLDSNFDSCYEAAKQQHKQVMIVNTAIAHCIYYQYQKEKLIAENPWLAMVAQTKESNK